MHVTGAFPSKALFSRTYIVVVGPRASLCCPIRTLVLVELASYLVRTRHPSGSSRWVAPHRGVHPSPGSCEPQKTFGTLRCPSRAGECMLALPLTAFWLRAPPYRSSPSQARRRGVYNTTALLHGVMRWMNRCPISHKGMSPSPVTGSPVHPKIHSVYLPPKVLSLSKGTPSRRI